MSDVIQCPQCDKRFRLPENVPPTFSCTGCGTLMDLSDFAGEAVEPEPVAPARPTRAGAGGAPRTRTQRRRGGGRRGAAPRRHARHGGGRARGGRRGRGRPVQDDDEPHGGYAERARGRQGNGLLIGSLIGLAAAVVLVIVMINMMSADKTDGGGKTTATNNGDAGTGKGGAGTKDGTKGIPVGKDGKELTAGTGDGGDEVVPPRKPRTSSRVRLSGLKLEKWPWPDGVEEETRAQVEEAIKNLYRGGRDAIEAEEFLVSKGRIICGRLISEFRALKESPGFQSREAASMAGAIDSLLRKIDGVIERKFYEQNFIRHSSQQSFILGIARRWTWWWKHEEWKNNPREPFDRFTESIEDIKAADRAPKKKKSKKSGYGKRAGG